MTERNRHLSAPLVGIALVAVFVLLGALSFRQVASVDVGFHLRAGEHILSGEGWPTTDPFTYTVGDHAYVDTSWGYQVALAWVERVLGAPGMVLLHSVFLFVAFGSAVACAGKRGVGYVAVPLLLLLGVLAGELRFQVRPELLSYAWLAVVLQLLRRHALGLKTPLWLLPVFFVAWVNCHSFFVLGWAGLFCFVAGTAVRDRRLDRELAGWSLVSVVATVLNPYGWRGVLFPLELVTRMDKANLFARSIGEFGSPWSVLRSDQLQYHLLPLGAFWILVAFAVFSMVPLWRQRRFSELLICATFLPLSMTMVRNMPLLPIAVLPGMTIGLAGIWPRGKGLRRAGYVLPIVAALLLTFWVRSDAYYVGNLRSARFGLDWNRLTQPVAAADWARSAKPPGRVLNHLNFGGYLMWALSEPVFIDGRLEVMGEEFFAGYRRILAVRPELERTVARYDIGWTVFPYKIAPRMLRERSTDPAWRLAHVDSLSVVFVRAGPSAAALVDATVLGRPEALEFESLPGLGGPARVSRWKWWTGGLIARREFPTEAFHLGLFHLYRGAHEPAAAYVGPALRESDGRFLEIYNNLGATLFRMNRLAQAQACYEVVLEEDPQHAIALRRMGDIEERLLN